MELRSACELWCLGDDGSAVNVRVAGGCVTGAKTARPCAGCPRSARRSCRPSSRQACSCTRPTGRRRPRWRRSSGRWCSRTAPPMRRPACPRGTRTCRPLDKYVYMPMRGGSRRAHASLGFRAESLLWLPVAQSARCAAADLCAHHLADSWAQPTCTPGRCCCIAWHTGA